LGSAAYIYPSSLKLHVCWLHSFATFGNRVALSTAKLMGSHSFAAAVQFQ
jgi:hypothetical protein